MRWLFLLLLTISTAHAQSFESNWFWNPTAVPSYVQVNLGATDAPNMFVNWFKAAIQQTFNGGLPSQLNSDNYPITTPTAQILYVITLPSLAYYSGTWELIWTGTTKLAFNRSITVVTDTQSCSQGSGVISGTNCDVVFNWVSSTPTTFNFPASGTTSGLSGMALIRSSDKATYLANPSFGGFTPEFLSVVANLRPLSIRTLGLSFPVQQNDEMEAKWIYQTTVNSLSYGISSWPTTIWAGTATGTDQYTLGSYTDMPVSWTDGEEFQANFTNASSPVISVTGAASDGGLVKLTVSSSSTLTTNQQVLVANNCPVNSPPLVQTVTVIDGTHVDLQGTTYSAAWACNTPSQITTTTINVGGRGSKFILPTSLLASPGIAAGANGTMVYDGILGLVIYNVGGIRGMPKQVQVDLANALGTSLWINVPPYYDLSSVQSLISYMSANINEKLYWELNDENWNYALQGQWFTQRGLALGIPLTSNRSQYGYSGLRSLQLFNAGIGSWTRSASSLIPILGGQLTGVPSQFNSYEFQGADLCGTSCGNATYQSIIGVDYNTAPNRPIDFLTSHNGAIVTTSYFSGAQESGNNAPSFVAITGTCNGTTCTGVIAAASCYAAPSDVTCGTGGTAQLALNFIDSDTRSGSFVGGSAGAYTIASLVTESASWNTIAAAYPVSYYAYEGMYSGISPTAAYLTTLGDANATTDAANIAALITAWKNNSLSEATVSYWNSQFFTNSQVKGNSALSVTGSSQWSLLSNGIFPFTAYLTYNAVANINGNAYPVP